MNRFKLPRKKKKEFKKEHGETNYKFMISGSRLALAAARAGEALRNMFIALQSFGIKDRKQSKRIAKILQ